MTLAKSSFSVEQAIFASSDRGSVKGYQLVGRSPGIDRSVAQTLCQWAPTQFPGADLDDWIISFFPVNDEMVAVTRTVLGGPEYSSRGGIQVVTSILVMSNDQFHAYSCNPVLVTKTALALGLMRLPMSFDYEHLPPAQLPKKPLVLPTCSSNFQRVITDRSIIGNRCEPEASILDNLADMIRQAQKVALIGIDNPLWLLDHLLQRLSLETRRSFSFTTGLMPSIRRPFQAHFLPHADPARLKTLGAQKIKAIRLDH